MDRLPGKRSADDPVMIRDPKIGWPAQLALGADGLGNAPSHTAHIMGQSYGSPDPPLQAGDRGLPGAAAQVYAAVGSPRGELDRHTVSDGGTRPYRVHFRDSSFTSLQAFPAMCEGGMVADIIAAMGSIDPVMGGVDR